MEYTGISRNVSLQDEYFWVISMIFLKITVVFSIIASDSEAKEIYLVILLYIVRSHVPSQM